MNLSHCFNIISFWLSVKICILRRSISFFRNGPLFGDQTSLAGVETEAAVAEGKQGLFRAFEPGVECEKPRSGKQFRTKRIRNCITDNISSFSVTLQEWLNKLLGIRLNRRCLSFD
jgi:hypothetical protein